MLKTIYIKLKKYYIAYKRLKAIRETMLLIQQIPNKENQHHRLHFYLFQLEREYEEILKKEYPRITELLIKR